MFVNPILLVDHSAYAVLWAALIGLGLFSALLKPRRLFFVIAATLVAIFLPPFHSRYFSLALGVGPVSLHIFDYLMLGMLLITLKLLFQNPGRFTNATPSIYVLLTIMFFGWHITRACIDIWIVGKSPEMVLRLFAGRAFVLFVILIPVILATSRDFSWEKSRLYLLSLIGLLPLIALYNVATVPEGLIGTSSGTRRFLIGTSNVLYGFAFVVVLAGIRARWFPRIPAYCYLSWILVGMLLTQHRSIVVSVIVVMGIDTLFCCNAKEKSVRIFAGIVLVLLGAIALPYIAGNQGGLVGEAVSRVGDTFDSSNATAAGRLNKWTSRIELFKQNPMLGIGFGREDATELGRSEFNKSAGHEAHNFIISVLTYEGLIGLLVNLTLLYFAFRSAYLLMKKSRRRGLEIPMLYLGFFVSYSLFNTTYFNPTTAPCMFAAIGVTAYLHGVFLDKPRRAQIATPLVDQKLA